MPNKTWLGAKVIGQLNANILANFKSWTIDSFYTAKFQSTKMVFLALLFGFVGECNQRKYQVFLLITLFNLVNYYYQCIINTPCCLHFYNNIPEAIVAITPSPTSTNIIHLSTWIVDWQPQVCLYTIMPMLVVVKGLRVCLGEQCLSHSDIVECAMPRLQEIITVLTHAKDAKYVYHNSMMFTLHFSHFALRFVVPCILSNSTSNLHIFSISLKNRYVV